MLCKIDLLAGNSFVHIPAPTIVAVVLTGIMVSIVSGFLYPV